MVSKTIDDFPEPDTPVKIVIFRFGMRSETSFRLFSRAPRISMNSFMRGSPERERPRSAPDPRFAFRGRLGLPRGIEGDCRTDERLEGGRVDAFPFVNIYRAAHVPVETRVEETGRILQRRALRERQLHHALVG